MCVKNKRITESDNSMTICDIGNAQCDYGTHQCNKKIKKVNIKCDYNMVIWDVVILLNVTLALPNVTKT